jgi:hypothetical protein
MPWTHLPVRQHGDVVPVQGALAQGSHRSEHLLLACTGAVDGVELEAHWGEVAKKGIGVVGGQVKTRISYD